MKDNEPIYFSHNLHSPNKKEVNFQSRVDVAEKCIFNKGWIPIPFKTDLPRLSLKKQGWEMEKYENTFRLKEQKSSLKVSKA